MIKQRPLAEKHAKDEHLATLSEDLLESENRYRSLFNSIDEGFCIIEMVFDAQNKPVDFLFLSVNPSFENQTGMRFAAGKRMRELVPDLEDHWFDIYGKVALTGEPIRYINEAKAMRNRWFDVYAFKTGAPGSYQVAVLFNDISGRKNAEAALIESEQRYRNLFNSMDEGFCIIKIIFDDDQKPVDYRFLEVNSSFERQSGLKNARGRLVSELVPNLDPHWYERYGRVALTGEPFRFVENIRGMDRWLDITAHRLGGPQDQTVAVVFNDLSDQKRAEELDLAIHTRTRELAFAKNELQEVCDTVRESLVVIDRDLRVVQANRSFYETFGLTRAEVKSQPFLTLGKGEWDAERLKSLRRALSKARKFDNFELGRIFENSPPQIFRFTCRLISTEGATRLLLAIEDVTLRKQAEEAESLRRSEALQREFVANVSHELRTPLASVLGYAETLRKGGLSDVKNRLKFVRVIEKQGQRLMHLVQNLLELASLESGRGRSKYEPILLRPFVLQLLSGTPRAARRQGIRIQIGIPEDLVAVVDKGQFAQVVQNLCENAVKYNRKNGRVVIDASNSAKETILSVKDTGIGISREDMPHIFDRFHRAVCHAGSRTGSGLGLAIAKNIVESHGGRIWAESEEGKGSAFFVALPAQLDIPL